MAEIYSESCCEIVIGRPDCRMVNMVEDGCCLLAVRPRGRCDDEFAEAFDMISSSSLVVV